HPYPTKELEAIWKEALLYQFHDILPGSSITRVYDESLARYQVLMEQTQQLLNAAQAALLAPGKQNRAVSVLNSLSWERSAWLSIEGAWRYITVPPLGYMTLDLTMPEETVGDQVVAAPDLLENDILRVQFAADGSIQSIFDKEYQREVLASGLQAN